MITHPGKVIITYGWCRVAYAALRCLARHGVEVIVGGPPGPMMAGHSKHSGITFTYPSPYTDPVGFVDCIAAVARKHDARVYIPIHEEIIPVALHRNRLPENLIVPIPSYEQIMTAHDKGLTTDAAKRAGVPMPETYHLLKAGDISGLSGKIKYPVLIKLRKSNSAKGVFRVNGPEELVDQYRLVIDRFEIAPESLPVIQEYIPGTVYAVSTLFNRGRLRTKFTRRNIREKTYGGGTCTKCISVRNPTIEDYAEKILTSMEWHGVAMLEFKYDDNSGRAHLLEINPRYHGTVDHDIQCGIPTPYLHYLMAVNGDVEPRSDYRLGVTSRWIIGDVIGIFDHMARMKGLRNKVKYMGSLLRFDEDNYMDLKADDVKPFFAQGLYYAEKFFTTGSRNPVDEGMVG